MHYIMNISFPYRNIKVLQYPYYITWTSQVLNYISVKVQCKNLHIKCPLSCLDGLGSKHNNLIMSDSIGIVTVSLSNKLLPSQWTIIVVQTWNVSWGRFNKQIYRGCSFVKIVFNVQPEKLLNWSFCWISPGLTFRRNNRK